MAKNKEVTEEVNNDNLTHNELMDAKVAAVQEQPTQVVEAGGPDVEVHKATEVTADPFSNKIHIKQVDKKEEVPVMYPSEANLPQDNEVINVEDTEVWKFLNSDEGSDSPAKAELRATLKKFTQQNPVKAQADIEDFKRQLNDPKFNTEVK